METALDRATRVMTHHPAPALPLDELQRLVRGSGGVLVSEEILVRALLSASDRLRLVDPWRGPWIPVRGAARPGFADLGRRWVVARPDVGGGEGGTLGRMRHTLAHLGWTVDETSSREMARWCRLVQEGGRLRDRVRASAAA